MLERVSELSMSLEVMRFFMGVADGEPVGLRISPSRTLDSPLEETNVA